MAGLAVTGTPMPAGWACAGPVTSFAPSTEGFRGPVPHSAVGLFRLVSLPPWPALYWETSAIWGLLKGH